MTQAMDQKWRQFWIFQTNPKQYNAKTQLTVGQAIDWYVSRFIERYRAGDIIYLWIAGEEAGIYGWAEVEGNVFKDDSGKQRLKAVYRGVLDKPLARPFLRAQPKVFDGMSILRNPTGTNFRVTVLEAIELNRLIASNGETPPPDPDAVEDPNNRENFFTKSVYVFDYRFDNDVKHIMANCLASAQAINQTLFPSLLIQSVFIYYANLLQQKAPPEFALILNDVLSLTSLRSVLNFQEQIQRVPTQQFSPALANQILVKRNALVLLAEARRIAIKTTGKELIQGRHLVGAILQGAVAPIQSYMAEKILEPVGLKLGEIRDSFIAQIERRWPDDKLANWRALINEELVPESPVESFIPLLTRIDSDSADSADVDLLNIDDDAIAISKVLCARDAAPPIAIGLFGEWGSGKTFFMRRIHRHVKSLTARVTSASAITQQAYQSKVAQIWFNAWNYQDGNLWASLVNHVFVGLKQEMKRLNKDTADEQFKTLMEQLDEEKLIEKRLQSSSARVNSLEKKQKDLLQRIEVLNSTSKKIQEQAPEAKKRLQLLNKLKSYGEEFERVFEIPDAQNTLAAVAENVEKVQSLVDRIANADIIERAGQFFKYLTRDFKATLLSFMAIAGVTLIAIVILQSNIPWASLWSALTVALSLLSTRLSKFGQVLSLVKKINQEFELAPQSSKTVQQTLLKNAREVRALELERVETSAELETSRKEYTELSASYGEPSDETFASFIFDRAESHDYKSQLGLLNMVRRDFSRLNELLTRQNDSSLPKIDRIILYIDDLDRCEPEIVVDVLQAIHLMLAFPLFMVVVGVDARWLGRSLKKRYSFLVHEKDDKETDDLDYHAASTHDYLEKIFQIPLWLKRLDGQRANDMMKALLFSQVAGSGTTKGNATESKQPQEKQEQPQTADEQKTQQDLTDNELFDDSEDQDENYADQLADDELILNNLVSTRALVMSDAELGFFQKLGAIVGRSPRAVKRFINLYRVLKASHRKARMVGFSENTGEFRAPLLLLAVVCGSPKEAESLFQLIIQSNKVKHLKGIVTKARELDKGPGWQQLVLALIASQDAIGELEIDQITEWIPEVARFSYREWTS